MGILDFWEIWNFGKLGFFILGFWDFVLWGRREKVSPVTVSEVLGEEGKGVTCYGFCEFWNLGIWEFWNLGISKSRNLGIWEFGHLGIVEFRNLGICEFGNLGFLEF